MCTSERAEASAGTYFIESEIVVVIVGVLVAPALERLFLFAPNWTFYLCQCDFLACFHVTFAQLRCQKPGGGPSVIVPLACQSLPVRRVEFWVLA